MVTNIANHLGSSLALYVHIPFCATKCPYCDFNTYSNIEPMMSSYTFALRQEIAIWGEVLERPVVNTIFFGGGTPSYLPVGMTASLMKAIHESFEVSCRAEISLEANPDDLDARKLAGLLDLGFNRLSIGFQSLDDSLLKILGRRHSARTAISAFHKAVDAGFVNTSIDLMYGLPRQTLETWKETLDKVCELNPPHLSMYCLAVESGTPLKQDIAMSRLPEPDPDLAADMYLSIEELMNCQRLHQYEISNWAKSGFESEHNLTYWRNQPYLGVGPGAHSYLKPIRFYNLRSPKSYVEKLKQHSEKPSNKRFLALDNIPNLQKSVHRQSDTHQSLPDPLDSSNTEANHCVPANSYDLAPIIQKVPVVERLEDIDFEMEMAETLMLGLRLAAGITVSEFKTRFGVTPIDAFNGAITEGSSLGLIDATLEQVRLTPKGRIFSNEVFTRLFQDITA